MRFSHVYVEKDVVDNPIAKKILNTLKRSVVIEIERYGHFFNRPRQSYLMQKKSLNIILAKKRYDFIYRGSYMCEDFGNDEFYHTSNILNCIYSCDYCYLQGMYPSANIVVFVNIEDFFDEVDKLTKNKKIYLSISYETDLMAFEPFTGFLSMWIDYAKKNKNLTMEVRTKSANVNIFENIEIPDNVIFSWSLLPQPVISMYEKLTPSIDKRILAIKKAIEKGVKVRISLEPIMYLEGFEKIYSDFIDKLHSELPLESIHDFNIGAFRMVKGQAKKIEKLRETSPIFCYETEIKNGICTYKNDEYMKDFVYNELVKYIDKERVFVK
ncbi:radical SAM protein [Thermoanaerobacterium sp. CMT5567-10]|uniref:SPL family radical SAM protein n=1 Tax=Thermoanaerobacterium sp. CMT5567-10 TaxID=3061989 RepID=UPI0026E0F191|nr:radical SAM protein [Thermoanaerobacterium sp. CMT5567-10]WKV07499.1 radical SAM protein [Thermoanaerobacterium sp. CMT5567-10]